MNEQELNNDTVQNQELTELQQRLDASLKSCNEWKEKYVHVSADLQNYKKRMEKEQITWAQRAQGDILLQILPIVDDFDRALSEHKNRERTPDLDEWLVGFELIGKSMYKLLHQVGVTEIEATASFDPNIHEAIVQVESNEHQSGDVVSVIQKGFYLNGQVLRPAKVTVAK